jgi:hypothetical protein
MEKYGFVYIWRDRKHNRYYIGAHWGREDDGYVCSSTWMKNAYKRRPNDFKRRILKTNIQSRDDMFEEEYRWLSMIKLCEIKKRYYNIHVNKYISWHSYDKNIKTMSQKISMRTKEAMAKPDIREKYLNGLKTRKLSEAMQRPEVKAKRSAALKGKNKGRKHTGEQLENMRLAAKNRHITESGRNGLRKAGSVTMTNLNANKITCYKCGMTSTPGVMHRFHNDNCKTIFPDWIAVRHDFEIGLSLRKLGDKYQYSRAKISKKSKEENWIIAQ